MPRPPKLMVKKETMPRAYCSPPTLPSIPAKTTIMVYRTTVTASAISNRILYTVGSDDDDEAAQQLSKTRDLLWSHQDIRDR